ncbi:MAG: hypothetical protein ACOCX2_05720 [Armatimonadota bacterium]
MSVDTQPVVTQTQKLHDRIVDEIEAALEDDERDLLAGGIALETLADRMSCRTRKTLDTHVSRLVDSGRLEKVDGANPDTLFPRVSYLPADHPDAGSPERGKYRGR